MIRKINGVDYPPIPLCQGQDSGSSSSTATTVLSSVFVSSDSLNGTSDGIRIKTLFRKGTVNGSTYDISLYWNTATTINAFAVELAKVPMSGTSSCLGIERRVHFSFIPSTYYARLMNTTTILESDDGVIGVNLSSELTNLLYKTSGYFMACAARTSSSRTNDTILCSYIYIENT